MVGGVRGRGCDFIVCDASPVLVSYSYLKIDPEAMRLRAGHPHRNILYQGHTKKMNTNVLSAYNDSIASTVLVVRRPSLKSQAFFCPTYLPWPFPSLPAGPL